MTPRSAPIRTFLDPRVEIYAPTAASPYYRLTGYHANGKRAVNTTGGTTIRSAKAEAQEVSRTLKLTSQPLRRDPHKTPAAGEAEQWLGQRRHSSLGMLTPIEFENRSRTPITAA